MFDSKNCTYILTILEAIEKILYYSQDFEETLQAEYSEDLKYLEILK